AGLLHSKFLRPCQQIPSTSTLTLYFSTYNLLLIFIIFPSPPHTNIHALRGIRTRPTSFGSNNLSLFASSSFVWNSVHAAKTSLHRQCRKDVRRHNFRVERLVQSAKGFWLDGELN